MTHDDGSLVAHARGGDAAAYAALLARHRSALLRACRQVLRDDDAAAADAAQEAALVAWLQLDRLREPERFGAWLCGIRRNVALGVARERALRRRFLSEDAAVPERAAPASDEPAERLLARERAADP